MTTATRSLATALSGARSLAACSAELHHQPGRDQAAETAVKVQRPRCRDKISLTAHSGLFGENREISISVRMRGGPGRRSTIGFSDVIDIDAGRLTVLVWAWASAALFLSVCAICPLRQYSIGAA